MLGGGLGGELPVLLGVAASTLLIYFYLVVLLRLTGNRALASLRAFDFVVVVAIGSLIATTVASESVPLLNGVVAITLLILLQWAVAWASGRNDRVNHWVTSPPTLLYYDGAFVEEGLRRARVTEAEVVMAMRRNGHGQSADVWAVVMETNGNMSVIGRDSAPDDGWGEGLRGATLSGMRMKARREATEDGGEGEE